MLIDSHCHLDSFENIEAIIANAKAAGVDYLLSACANLNEFPKLLEIANNHNNIFISAGLHPSEQVDSEPTVEQIINYASDKLVVAVGEVGLDYHYPDTAKDIQRKRFINHISAARQIAKPLIIHTREANKDMLEILKGENVAQIGGVMHCFTEDWEMAKKCLDMNLYISFSGIITFKNAEQIREVAKKVPIDRMLVETDSPYLAPVPYRGKQNQPEYVRYVAECIAQTRNLPFETVATQTSDNFFKLFGVLCKTKV